MAAALLLALALGPEPEDADEIDIVGILIARLDADRPDDREEAAARLREIGLGARPALEAAARSPNSETAGRARAILDRLYVQWGSDTLRRIETAARRARTLRLRYSVSSDGKTPSLALSWTYAGTVLVKDGDRFRLDGTVTLDGKTREKSLLAEGRTVTLTEVGTPETSTGVAETVHAHLMASLVREGPAFLFNQLNRCRPEGPPWKSAPTVTFLPEPPVEGLVRYEIALPDTPTPCRVELSFDPRTLRPLRRVVRYEDPGWSSVTTETYDEWVVDRDLPDEWFVVPPP